MAGDVHCTVRTAASSSKSKTDPSCICNVADLSCWLPRQQFDGRAAEELLRVLVGHAAAHSPSGTIQHVRHGIPGSGGFITSAQAWQALSTARDVACRKTIFLKEIGSWMSDPKLPDSVRERWFDIWERVDPGLVNKVGPVFKDGVMSQAAECPFSPVIRPHCAPVYVDEDMGFAAQSSISGVV